MFDACDLLATRARMASLIFAIRTPEHAYTNRRDRPLRVTATNVKVTACMPTHEQQTLENIPAYPQNATESTHRSGKYLLETQSENGDQGTCLPSSPPKRLQSLGAAPWGCPLSRCPASWRASAQPADRLRKVPSPRVVSAFSCLTWYHTA